MGLSVFGMYDQNLEKQTISKDREFSVSVYECIVFIVFLDWFSKVEIEWTGWRHSGQPAVHCCGTVCLLLIRPTAIMIIILHPQPNDQDVIKGDILWILFVHLKTEIGETQIKLIDFIERCCLIWHFYLTPNVPCWLCCAFCRRARSEQLCFL